MITKKCQTCGNNLDKLGNCQVCNKNVEFKKNKIKKAQICLSKLKSVQQDLISLDNSDLLNKFRSLINSLQKLCENNSIHIKVYDYQNSFKEKALNLNKSWNDLIEQNIKDAIAKEEEEMKNKPLPDVTPK
jgi:hypothetical protein